LIEHYAVSADFRRKNRRGDPPPDRIEHYAVSADFRRKNRIGDPPPDRIEHYAVKTGTKSLEEEQGNWSPVKPHFPEHHHPGIHSS
jgi:hypothetical protein